MREIRGEHKRLRTNTLDRIGERLFVPFTADKDSIVGKIVGRMTLELEAAVFELALEPVEHEWNPCGAALHQSQSEPRKAIEDTIDHHPCERDCQRKRHSKGTGGGKNGKRIEPEIDIAAPVYRHHAVQLFGFFVDGPVFGMTHMPRETV